MVEDLSKTYGGKPIIPAVISSASSDSTYQIQYINTDTDRVLQEAPSDAGNYRMTIFSAVNDHYNAVEYAKTFTICKKIPDTVISETKNIYSHIGIKLSEVVLPEG